MIHILFSGVGWTDIALTLNRVAVGMFFMFHPEFLVSTMPFGSARTWQTRLQELDEGHRLVDRKLLLCDD